MKRLPLVMLLVAAPVAPSIDARLLVSFDKPATSLWRHNSALAQTADVSAKEAFEAAKELGTVEAWEAFLKSFPTGFYADLARAYLKKLSERWRCAASGHGAGRRAPRARAAAPERQPRRPRSDRPGQARGHARRPLHGLRREVQPLLHRPGLEALADRLCEPERQRQRREPRHAHVGAGCGRGRAARHPDLFPPRQVPGLLRVHQGDQRHL